MRERATIVHVHHRLGYVGVVVSGTIESYYPWGQVRLWRPTARWARRAGDAWIARRDRVEQRLRRAEDRARLATGYDR